MAGGRKPSLRFVYVLILVLAYIVSGDTALVSAQTDALLWEAWAAMDINLVDDDGTGASFQLGKVGGRSVLTITPGGSSEETKLAYPVRGDELRGWAEYGQIRLRVYLPKNNKLNPNMFFLGLGDATSGWSWVGGQFGTADGTSGWVTIRFTLDPALRETRQDGAYIMYLAFFNQEGSGSKTPLTEPFYVGDIHLELTAIIDIAATEARYQQEVDALLTMDDDALLATVARETFDFFWHEASPNTGLILDRNAPNAAASIASVGFGLAAIPVAIERGWITHDAGYERARLAISTFVNGAVQGEHGFFYHFVDVETGERRWNSEVSSIDTVLLVAGALVAGQYFEGTEVHRLANKLYENVEWDWMMSTGSVPRMGWLPERGFLRESWDHFDESLILYVLALGSPTHPIPDSTWDLWRRPVNVADEYIYLPGEPLFVYQFPLAFVNLRNMEDAYANYWNNAVIACERNRQFAFDRSDRYQTYRNGVWGLSASDGPFGYRAYGAYERNHDGTVAPYASIACLPFTPEYAFEGMRALLNTYGSRVWREYGFVSAINADEDWYSREHIGIDQGDILLMISNVQDGAVWKLFMSHPRVQVGLDAMGFVESAGDYAITPAYLSKVTDR
jgi:hypothetical protein